MNRTTAVSVLAAVVGLVVAAASVGAVGAPVVDGPDAAVQADGNGLQTNGTDGGGTETVAGNETEDEPVEPRRLRNGTFRFDGATLTVENVLLTDRNGTLQLFVKNATVVGENATTTVLNARIAIGRNLSDSEVRRHYRAIVRALANASTPVDAANATTPDAVVPTPATATPGTATPTPDANATRTGTGTPAGTATKTETAAGNATERPQVDDLRVRPVTGRLAARLPPAVLDTPTLVTADVARVRTDTATRTYRSVVLRGTLREVLTGGAATTLPERNRPTAAETGTPVANGAATATGTATATDTGVRHSSFDVTDLRAPENATVDAAFNVTATVSNPGSEVGYEQVNYEILGERVAAERIRLEPGASRNVTFRVNLGPLPLEPGEYVHGVYGFRDSATATIELTAANGTGGEPTG